mgnify:FL=1
MTRRANRARKNGIPCRAIVQLSAAAVLFALPGTALGQKTDTLTVRTGAKLVGDIKGLSRGQVNFLTDEMGTVQVRWPKVVTVHTDKIFEIELEDGRVLFGSLVPGGQDSVLIRADSLTLAVPTQTVVTLERIKSSFWAGLDGNLNVGLNFTQQNAKTDVNINGSVHYAARKTAEKGALGSIATGFNLTKLTYNFTFSRQDETDDIRRAQSGLSHLNQLASRWFWTVLLTGETNSQLSLDYRVSVGGGGGRFLVQSNKLDVAVWLGPAYSWEQFTGEPSDSSFPFMVASDLTYFTWGALSTTISSNLAVMPILDDWGRWRINFNATASREVLNNLYLNLSVTEVFDSRPTSADANKNDFSFTTSIGWTF